MAEKNLALKVGEIIVSREPAIVSTILGSCVSVCLFSVNAKAGGMVHYALPVDAEGSAGGPLRYAKHALPELLKRMKELTGLRSGEFSAKILGGADVAEPGAKSGGVGALNIEAARKFLKDHGIPVVGEDVGGKQGRNIQFFTETGRVRSAMIENKNVAAAEKTIEKKVLQMAFDFQVKASAEKKIKVMVVDDSKTIRDMLCKMLARDPQMEVVAVAEDPLKAEELLRNIKPDVITLDVHMPKMTGVQWLNILLPRRPIPVVMTTSLDLKDGNEVFQALEMGAVDYIQKPTLGELPEFTPIFLEKVRAAATAKVKFNDPKTKAVRNRIVPASSFDRNLVIAIGSSTGGTEALKDVLTRLPAEIPPIVIVQHIPPVFSKAFAERMDALCPFDVKEAEDGDAIHENRVLIAPGATQMKVVRRSSGLFVNVNNDGPVNRHKPSVDYLFDTVAEICGRRAIGAVLTGMGADGARGLLKMRQAGAQTLSQTERTCVVYGMPKAAWEMGGSQQQVDLEDIAERLVELGKARKAA